MIDPQLAPLILSGGTFLGALVSAWISFRNGKKIEQVHIATNGLSERNEKIARKLGVAEGKELQKQEDK